MLPENEIITNYFAYLRVLMYKRMQGFYIETHNYTTRVNNKLFQ